MNVFKDSVILEAEVTKDAFVEACNKSYDKLMSELDAVKLMLTTELKNKNKTLFRLDKRKLKSKKDKVTVDVMFTTFD